MMASGRPDKGGLLTGVLVVATGRPGTEEQRVVVMNSVIDSSAELLLKEHPPANRPADLLGIGYVTPQDQQPHHSIRP